MIESKIINYNDTKTELCNLGEKYGTDKSPFNNKPFVHGGKGHRHPYTCFYDSIFNNIKNNKLKILEIGILFGDSIKCWNEYFKNAEIIGVDLSEQAKKTILQLNNTTFDTINVCDEKSIINIFDKYGPFDIIIDDASHKFNDQINVIKNAYKYLNNNGYLIIEDIFENKDIFMKYNNEKYKNMNFFSKEESELANKVSIEELYYIKLKSFIKNFNNVFFYTLRHNNIYTPGWNNNKLLVFQK